jgi:hypothetical protein
MATAVKKGRDYRRLQALVLRLVGAAEIFAFGAVVMPRAWMEEAHEALGLGAMPVGAVVDSLVRQVSFTYGLHGVALWFIAADVLRYRPLVILTGAGYLLAAPVLALVDLSAGMPAWWAANTGGSCLLIGVLMLGLEWFASQKEKAAGP